MFSIGRCPICGGGLCGVRLCGAETHQPHGLIVCDECEATWLRPDLNSPHQYLDSCDSRCPVCVAPLWGSGARWATYEDLLALGWESLVDPGLIWNEPGPGPPSTNRRPDSQEP
jgi:hypothetical protein